MHGMLSSDDQASPDAADDWIGIFQQRGVWHLTRDIVDRWVARNVVFFDMLCRLTPPGSKVLELGCGPGRHALGAATLGYHVVGIDRDPLIIAQAEVNARSVAPEAMVTFQIGDMFNLGEVAPQGTFHTITHGGVMEHLDSARSIRETLSTQLAYASTVVFDVPINSAKNRLLFQRDDIFRQLWTPDEWVHDVLAGLPIADARSDLHQEDNMTDDLVVALRA
jgi:2-polyprenyl-3-methyl-5-hydroxy-6-metoxy-1,4-benzoquinol methylase